MGHPRRTIKKNNYDQFPATREGLNSGAAIMGTMHFDYESTHVSFFLLAVYIVYTRLHMFRERILYENYVTPLWWISHQNYCILHVFNILDIYCRSVFARAGRNNS